MDALELILTKLDVRNYASKKVSAQVKMEVLEAAIAAGTGNNLQHWRFILVQDKDAVSRLSKDSISGPWVDGADFAVIVLTDPKLWFRLLDVGRAVQNMQLAAWNRGVISGIYTDVNEQEMKRDFAIPDSLKPSAIVAFGYPARRIVGKKNRKPLEEVVSLDKFSKRFNSDDLT